MASVVGILQARLSSSRLPGKVLLPILGEPMLFRHLERLRRSTEMDRVVVATSTDPSDDPLAAACRQRDVPCFRGDLHDVLRRVVDAARPYRPDAVVRLTGDCPLADPALVDDLIRYFRAGSYDYASNCFPPTFPDGLDAEVVRFSSLEEAYREAVLPSHREHVTPFLRAHLERYRIGHISGSVDRSAMRWTVDEPEDFEFVRQVYERLYPTTPEFDTPDILDLLAREPALQAINARFTRNEGSHASRQADAEYLSRNA
ncbi:MAG: spore coat protein [Acidobacteria bacterium RIFCSPLOWO2_02_FULL_68_18]|nr:MAG: spore coat protein [Acidobacteria bacterium RIFCSPLOWO2_02_FULL_68_18]OFW48261.1 MAG: spore coat protein [Acidobacteria bacterium RIFCSPLOWO2_12_FULL_68_19]